METRRFLIKVTEKTTNDGKKFYTYKTFSKNGRAVEVKFTQESGFNTKEDCIIEVLEGKCDLNTSGMYPVLWIRKVERVVPKEEIDAERAVKNAKKLEEFFGARDASENAATE